MSSDNPTVSSQRTEVYELLMLKSPSLVAVNVARGDAFYLALNGLSVLVDGGESQKDLPQLFKTATGQASVDILVCTHNDADHANGVIGFLESSLRASEVWLPGSWTYRIDDLLARPAAFIDELIEDVSDVSLDLWSVPPDDEGASSALERLAERGEISLTGVDLDEARDADLLQKIIASAARRAEAKLSLGDYMLSAGCHTLSRSRVSILHASSLRARVLMDAIEAGDRIRNIALAAYRRGIPIRWFAYQRSRAAAGGHPRLQPANAREVARIRPQRVRKRLRALYYLALTSWNKECLVFYVPPAKGMPPVLFTADSPLCFAGTIGWRDKMLVTVPHHGSESNRHAYVRYGAEKPPGASAVWVRTNGEPRTRAGRTFCMLSGRRYCTRCNNPPSTDQSVQLYLRQGYWVPFMTRKCSCPPTPPTSPLAPGVDNCQLASGSVVRSVVRMVCTQQGSARRRIRRCALLPLSPPEWLEHSALSLSSHRLREMSGL